MNFTLVGKTIVVSDPAGYITWVIGSSILIRIIMSIFKMLAVKLGEADERNKEGEIINSYIDKWTRWGTFWVIFGSCGRDEKLNDFFLSTILGWLELLSFPVFIVLDKWQVIAFWITIKTAAHWNRWSESRTPYMRYLVGNALMLLAAFILTRFVK